MKARTSRNRYYRMPLTLIVKGIFFMVLILTTQPSHAQLWDSIRHHLSARPKLDARLNGRSSFVGSTPAKLGGVQVGVSYDKRVKVGIGFNTLGNEIFRTRLIDGEEQQHQFRMTTVMPYFEYVFLMKGKWEALITMQAGLGRSHYEYKSTTSNYASFFVYEPHMTGIYLPWKWIGIGAGVGYSITLPGKKITGEQLTAPIYLVKLVLRPMALFG